MGIQGLIPFLEKSSKPVNISQYSGCTVAVDAYCWLHKGTFSCAEKLARGEKTDAYVTYCMKYVNMLLSHKIKPILVFDGRRLPAKAGTENKRRQNREINKRRAAELLRLDKPNEARTFLQRCVDVTHAMALELMKECRSRNVDCITAPYEADAELAYLNINNIAHIVITEDSDLLLFGCTKVIFKLDLNGNGLLVDQDKLHLAMGVSKGCFSMDKFRHMCILSGCDYLPSLPKIGLGKACRFVKSTVDPDIHRALSRLGGHLNMNIVVPMEYRDKFLEAEAMFLHQPVFDPLSRQLLPLTPLPNGVTSPPLLSQEKLNEKELLELAYGNLDPVTLKRVDNWSPHLIQETGGRTNTWNVNVIAPHKSIWSQDFKAKTLVIEHRDPCKVKRLSTSGKLVEKSMDISRLPTKRSPQSIQEELNSMRSHFSVSPHPSKKPRCENQDILDLLERTDQTPPNTEVSDSVTTKSPKKSSISDSFIKTTPSSNKFSGLSKLARFRKTIVNETDVVQSRYFGSIESGQELSKPNNRIQNQMLKDVSHVFENQTTNETSSNNKTNEKLSDSGIQLLMEELTENVKDERENLSNSNGKENISQSSCLKHENNFKWRPSLAEMFGFKNKITTLPPLRNGVKILSKEKLLDDESESSISSPVVQESKTFKRNPFAKVTKVEECSYSLGSQGSSPNTSSQSDILTPETISSTESFTSVPTPILNGKPKPMIKIGLSKKRTNGCQKDLLTMFAFKPKMKLQR